MLGTIMLMKEWIPKEIKELRKTFELSQRALSEMVGVTVDYIYLLERGLRSPSKTLRILLSYVEKELIEKEKGGDRKHGKRHI